MALLGRASAVERGTKRHWRTLQNVGNVNTFNPEVVCGLIFTNNLVIFYLDMLNVNPISLIYIKIFVRRKNKARYHMHLKDGLIVDCKC